MEIIELIGEKLYQWDTGRKIIINPPKGITVDEIHFAGKGDTVALVVLPKLTEKGLIADIPDILLQRFGWIRMWAVTRYSDGSERTVSSAGETIIPRAKPEDYVYTETEVLRYEKLEKRIEKLEKNGGNGTSNAVQYIEQTLTEEQQIQARTNIGAASANEVSKLSEDIADLKQNGTGSGNVKGQGIYNLVALTQAEYDDLEEKVATTLYIITDATSDDTGNGDDEGGEDTPTNMIPYLKSDGVAYIKLPHGHIEGATYEVCFRADENVIKNSTVFGNRYTSLNYVGNTVYQAYISGFYNNSSYATFGDGTINIAKKHIYTIASDSLVLDNDVITEITAGTNTNQTIFYMFAKNNANTNNGEYLSALGVYTFFYLKIKDSKGDLIYNYQPAEDSEGVACIYESVNKTYLYNAAESGGFTYGTELEES